jgi:hypothetical protein
MIVWKNKSRPGISERYAATIGEGSLSIARDTINGLWFFSLRAPGLVASGHIEGDLALVQRALEGMARP